MAAYILDPGEIILQRVNRSLFDLMPVVVSSALITLVALSLMYGYGWLIEQFPIITPTIAYGVAGVLLILVTLILLSAMYVYSKNYLLITNLHVIKMEQMGLFAQQTAQLSLSRVQDVKGGRNGILGTLFDFGDVEVQTAGEDENFIFRTVPHPQLLADQLLQYHENFIKTNPERELP